MLCELYNQIPDLAHALLTPTLQPHSQQPVHLTGQHTQPTTPSNATDESNLITADFNQTASDPVPLRGFV